MIRNIAMLVIETVKLLLAMCGCLNYKIKKNKVSAWVVFVLSIICIIIIGIWDSDYRTTTFYFIAVVICSLAIEGKKKGLLSLALYLGISCIDSVLLILLETVFSVPKENILKIPIAYVGLNAVTLLLLTVTSILLHKVYYGRGKKSSQEIHSSNRQYLGLFAIGVSAFMIATLPITADDFMWNKVSAYMIITAAIVFVLLFLCMGILLVYNNSARRHYKEMARVNRELLESRERYYQMLLQREESTRRFRHDISSHIICVKRLLKDNKIIEAEKYLDDIGGTLNEFAVKYQTGNTLVDAIVNDISQKYVGVSLDWKGHLPKQLQMSDMDVCVIFSNLLENAFFAAAACEDGGAVDVTIESVAGTITIMMENDIAMPIEEKQGRLITQKADKRNHGYGTRNVRDCVAKNEGTVTFDYTDKNFMAKVVLVNVA